MAEERGKAHILGPEAYLDQFVFSATSRYVVKADRAVHVLIASVQGKWVVCIEKCVATKWGIVPGTAVNCSSRSHAARMAAELHRRETGLAVARTLAAEQKAIIPEQPKLERVEAVLKVCPHCLSNPHLPTCPIARAYGGT